MKRITGIIVWNVYAWPITMFLLFGYAETGNESPVLTILNFLLNMSALIALHLNVWDKEVGTQTSRKVYLLTFITWKLLYNIVLYPELWNKLNPEMLFISLLIWLPLYVAVFIFAFRNWESTKNQPSLGRKSKIIIIVLLTILIIVFIIMPIFFQVYEAFIIKNDYSRANHPALYIVPVERKIAEIKDQTQDNVKINYANFEMKLPCKKIGEERIDFASLKCKSTNKELDSASKKRNLTSIRIDKSKGKGIYIEIPTFILPKDKYEKRTAYEKYSKILYMTPDQVNFFSLTKKNDEKYQLFWLKQVSIIVPHLDGIYKFETSDVKGFQFIDLYNVKRNKYVKVLIFDKNDNTYELAFIGFSQKEIDYTLSSIRFK